ncbi:MAG: hypothetical protein CTY31_02270 [Hyphomicrobium sp.]|nr:MAG: hypothetical protein CTY39_01055 [Hyphomicrobium sp.]PPD01601.1 MAG: hypothetical protein CTY31_02270 [Hyphomicrobium sp.]
MPSQIIKVLHVIPSVSLVHGGPTHALNTIERALTNNGIDVTTLTTDDDGPQCRLALSAQPDRTNNARRVYFRKQSDFYKVALGVIPWLWRNVHTFDAIHIHGLFSFTSIVAGYIARIRGIPYVVRPLGTLADYGQKTHRPTLKKLSLAVLEGPILSSAYAVHFTSENERTEAEAIVANLSGIVIPLGIEMTDPDPSTSKKPERPVAATDAAIHLLFLSRIHPKKNIEGLLHAIAAIVAEGSHLRLDIAGEGSPDYVHKLQKLAATLGLQERIFWLGHVDGPQKAATFATADIYLLPSFSENFGIAAAEAMAAGKACILGSGVAIGADAARCGAALLVEPEPEHIAAALRRLLHNKKARLAMGTAANSHARRMFSTDLMAHRMAALYDKMAASNRAVRP